jgi:hypothetical protein
MKEHIVIDDFLSSTYHKEIEAHLLSFNFEWYYQSNITDTKKINDTDVNQHGFTHWFMHPETGMVNSSIAHLIRPLLLQIQDTLNAKRIIRARADMTMLANKKYIHSPHVDFPFPNISAVYYVNNSDGNTIIYKETTDNPNADIPKKLTIVDEVEPIANRLLLFDGFTLHTGSSPLKNKNRVLINSNYQL